MALSPDSMMDQTVFLDPSQPPSPRANTNPTENKNKEKKDTSKLSGAPSITGQIKFDPGHHPSMIPNLNLDQEENKNKEAENAPYGPQPMMGNAGFINPNQQYQMPNSDLREMNILKIEKRSLLRKIEMEEKTIKEQSEALIALRDKTLGLILELADDAANNRKPDKKKVIICEYLKEFWKEQGLWKKVILNIKGGM